MSQSERNILKMLMIEVARCCRVELKSVCVIKNKVIFKEHVSMWLFPVCVCVMKIHDHLPGQQHPKSPPH